MADPLDLEPQTRDELLRTGTAPIASQLLKRGLRNVFVAGSAPIDRLHARMVGPAYTLRFIPMREDLAVAGSSSKLRAAVISCFQPGSSS